LAKEMAGSLGSADILVVQHHHAHVAAVLAEHGEVGPAVALAFDGTGYGEDGHTWGGEILLAELGSCRRAGRLRYVPLPGGEAAVRNPWRTALGYLSLDQDREEDLRLAFSGVGADERRVVARQARTGFNAPLASSVGRLFDAVAAVLGLRHRCAYEGQAAMELEAAAEWQREGTAPWIPGGGSGSQSGSNPLEPALPELPFPAGKDETGVYVMDPLPLLSALGRARQRGVEVGLLAAAFHTALARTSAQVAGAVAQEAGISRVVLCGGVFQNALLLRITRELLEAAGLEVLTPRVLGPNDGAISYGQAAVAAARIHARGGG
jgi:hydrogenase maturation protein HypF